jgi:Ca2+-binding RTX toxin-like protein
MMDNQATVYLDNANMSKAAYADLTKGMSKQEIIDELTKQRGLSGNQLFTVKEAQEFAGKYMVTDRVKDPESGAYAVIFAERKPDGTAGAKTLAVRGTEATDLGDIKEDLKIWTIGLTSGGQYKAVKDFYDRSVESGIIGAGEKINVTGHSLGGYIATCFAWFNSSVVDHAYTYNSPGFGGVIAQAMTYFGLFPDNLPYGKITHILSAEFPVKTSGYGLFIGDIVALAGRSHGIQSVIDILSKPGAYYVPESSLCWWPVNIVESIRSLFKTAETVISPIVLDLDGDGVETTGVKSGAFFDHDGNGFAEQTAWVKADDGLLVFDKNGNGTIDNGLELFGDHTLLADGTRAANGFQALAELDGNADGKIDAGDAAYADLKIWQDADGDGYSTPGELRTLSELGIAAIDTGFTQSALVDANGNAHQQAGSYQKTDGSTGIATDVWFRADKMFSITAEMLDVPADIAALPDLQGSGNVHGLHQAMVRDTSGQLQSLVQQFIAAVDPSIRSALMDQILFNWTGSDSVSPTSRGPFFDAQKLGALEKMIGESFIQDANPDPGPAAVHSLGDAYKILSESLYGQLMAQTHLKDLFARITYIWDKEASCVRGELGGAATSIQNELNRDYETGKDILTEFLRTLRGLGADEQTNLSAFCEIFACQGSELLKITEEAGRNVMHLSAGNDSIPASGLGDLIYGYAGNDNIPGGPGNDKIHGGEGSDTLKGDAGNDLLEGGSGDDNLTGGLGNDRLIGGTGNDYLIGNEGSDAYQFSRGQGTDRIMNHDGGDSGVDTLEFVGGVSRNHVEFIMTAGYELIVRIKDSGEEVYVNNWFSPDANYRLDRFKFSDGGILTTAQLEAQGYRIYGTEGNDSRTGSASIDKMYGYGGDDSLNGNTGNDTLQGGSGDDNLTGGLGNDRLIGGTGNDFLIGNEGSDAYQFSRGQGTDRIMNHDGGDSGVDTLEFVGGVSRNHVEFIMTAGYELIVRIKDSGEEVYVNNWFSPDANYRLDRFKFSDGGILTTAQLQAEGYRVYGAAGDDNRTGSTSNDTMYGYEGNDTLHGGVGNDRLDGGVGSDLMYGNAGNDVYMVDNSGDCVIEMASEGTDTVRSSISYSLGSHVEKLTLTGGEAINGTGNALNNVLTGNNKINILKGGAGNDTLDGRGGNDTLDGGIGSDTYLFRLGDGQDFICDYSTLPADVDILRFKGDIGRSDPVIVRQNDHLYVFLDETNYVIVEDQYQGPNYGIERLEISDGHYMMRSDIENIVNAMSGINDAPCMDALLQYDALKADPAYLSTLTSSWCL